MEEENKKVNFTKGQRNKLVNEIEELKKILNAQISKTGITNKETIETSQNLDELIIKYIQENEI